MLEGLDKAGSELKGTTEEEVGDERPPTAIPIGDDPKDRGAGCTEEEGEGDRCRLGCNEGDIR